MSSYKQKCIETDNVLKQKLQSRIQIKWFIVNAKYKLNNIKLLLLCLFLL